jgi:hypothetical protein
MHNEELLSLYPSPNIIRMIESKGMEWIGSVARMGKAFIQTLVRKTEERSPLGRLGIDGRVILKWILIKLT